MSVDVISLGISLQALQNATPGWSPAIAIVSDGARCVVKIHDWVGGGGLKPASGLYIGAAGLSANIADGVDIRGPNGVGDVGGPAGATSGAIVVFDGATGKLIKSAGVVPSLLGLALLGNVDAAAAQQTLGLVPGVDVQTPSQVDAKLSAYQLAAQKGAANGYAGLDAGGKIPTNQLPALAITDTFAVASQAAMLALSAERGDVAVRSDVNKSFILAAEPASTLANWRELLSPIDASLAARILTAGAGLTGGGALSANQTFNVGPGIGIVVNADDVAVDKATAADLRAGTTNKVVTADIALAAMAWVPITYSATLAVSHSDGVNRSVTLQGNPTISGPTSAKEGWPLNLLIKQDATGSRVPAWATDFDFGDAGTPTLSTDPTAADLVCFVCVSAGKFAFTGMRKRVD